MKKKLQIIIIIILVIVSISFKVYSQTNKGVKVKYYSGNCENGTGTLIAPVSDYKFHGNFKNGLLEGVVIGYVYEVYGPYSSDPDFFIAKMKQKTKGIITFDDFDNSFKGLYFCGTTLTMGEINSFITNEKIPDIENPLQGVNYYNYKGHTHLYSEDIPKNGLVYYNRERNCMAFYEYTITKSGIKKTFIQIGEFSDSGSLNGIGVSVLYLENDLRIKHAMIGEFKDGKLHGEGAEYKFNKEDFTKLGDFKEGKFENGEYKGTIIDNDF